MVKGLFVLERVTRLELATSTLAIDKKAYSSVMLFTVTYYLV